jgi:hypothetical protein
MGKGESLVFSYGYAVGEGKEGGGMGKERDQTISSTSCTDPGRMCAGSGGISLVGIGTCTLAWCKDDTSISASPSSPPMLSVSDDADQEVGEDE